MTRTTEAAERLGRIAEMCDEASAVMPFYIGPGGEGMAADLRTVLAALRLYEAEVRAWRAFDWENWVEELPHGTPAWKRSEDELRAARAATDAFEREGR